MDSKQTSDGRPTAVDLLQTIRKTVNEWAVFYGAASGHAVAPAYLASLANDVAFELGILEAAKTETRHDSAVHAPGGGQV